VKKSDRTILLVGATGNLGAMIGKELVARGARLRLLVRPGSRKKLAAELAASAEIVETDTGAFEGVYAVVSAVQGGRETIVDLQLSLLKQARAAGVRRFIPSDYSYNIFTVADGQNVNTDWRREFAHRAEQERGDVEVVHVMNGCFLDAGVLYGFLGAIDLEKGEAYLWGDGSAQMEFTTYADTAAYTAEAALSEVALPREFFVAGDSLDFAGLVAETEAGLGRKIAVRRMGTLGDLDAEIARRREAEPGNVYAWLPLMYWRAMLNGQGKLGELRNGDYPWIRPVGVQEYASQMAVERRLER
jgi:hypothetical protein